MGERWTERSCTCSIGLDESCERKKSEKFQYHTHRERAKRDTRERFVQFLREKTGAISPHSYLTHMATHQSLHYSCQKITKWSSTTVTTPTQKIPLVFVCHLFFRPPFYCLENNEIKKTTFRWMFSVILSILIGLVISLVVVFDWSNCDKIESACFYALAIPGVLFIFKFHF